MKKIILSLLVIVNIFFIVVLLINLRGRGFLAAKRKSPKLEKTDTVIEKPQVFEKKESTAVVTEVSPVGKKKRNIRFKHWAPQAKKVEIVGDFNNWIPTLMTKDESQHWVIDYQLAPGEYTYKFLVDGRLRKDPYNSRRVPDGYGGESSLLIVKPVGEK